MKRLLFVMAAVLMASALMFVVAPERAQAQNCCSYTVKIAANVPAACLPLRVGTRWGAGVWHSSHSTTGTFIVDPPTPPFPVCPPNFLGNLLGATLNNFGSFVGPNQCACLPSGTSPCNLYVCTYQDQNGCWVVSISFPCP